MKKHYITIILIAVIVISEIIFISGFNTRKILKIHSNLSNYTTKKTENLYTEIDTLFYQDDTTKLIYYVPDSYSYEKTKEELNLLHKHLYSTKSQKNIWIISNSPSNDQHIQHLANQYNFNYTSVYQVKFRDIDSINKSLIFELTNEYKTANPRLAAEMKSEELKTYIENYFHINKM